MISANEERIKTNKLLLDICNFNKDLFDTTTLSPEEIQYYNKITDGFNNQIQSYIDWLDSDEAKRIFQDYTQYNDQIFSNIDEYTQEIINDTRLTSDEIIDKIYDAGLTHGYKEIKRTKHYNDATQYGLKFLQEYNFNLISNVNEDLKKHIRTQIFNGIVAGETMPEVAQKILHSHETSLTGKTLSARQRAMMIARTETARAMTQGRLQSYANYGVQEVKILTAGDSSVCAICREAANKIFPISDAANLVPFHPLCRCSVIAYIRHGILQGKPDDDAQVINLTPIEFNEINNSLEDLSEDEGNYEELSDRDSSKNPSNDIVDVKWDEIKTPHDVAKYFGYDYAFENDRHFFFDKKGNTSIVIDRYHTIGKGSKIHLIDFNNSNQGVYNLKEIIKIYNQAPLYLKKSTNEIVFLGQKKGKPNVLGDTKAFLEQFLDLSTTKRIRIYAPSLKRYNYSRGNVAQTMYHEMFHCWEYSQIKDQKVIDILSHPSKYSQRDKNWAKKYAFPISKNPNSGWNDVCDEDTEYQEENKLPVEGASWYADKKGSHENLAEVGSMVAFHNIEDKSMAVQQDNSKINVYYDEWIKRHPNKYNFLLKKLNEGIEITFKQLYRHI